MCGRYISVTKLQEIGKRFGVKTVDHDKFIQNTNVSIGDFAPVITNEKPGELQFFQFGFTVSWAKKQSYLINARTEGDHNKINDPNYHGAKGIINKPMFRKAIRSQRCLVIADAFVEGPVKERLNKPYLVYLQNKERPFCFAGIWDVWKNIETGESLPTYSIITTVANDLMLRIGHQRSPVVLPREYEKDWLAKDISLDEITSLLEPYPANLMNAYPISSEIKNPKVNGLQLLKPTGERIYKEYDYRIYEELKLQGMGKTTARQRRNSENTQGELF